MTNEHPSHRFAGAVHLISASNCFRSIGVIVMARCFASRHHADVEPRRRGAPPREANGLPAPAEFSVRRCASTRWPGSAVHEGVQTFPLGRGAPRPRLLVALETCRVRWPYLSPWVKVIVQPTPAFVAVAAALGLVSIVFHGIPAMRPTWWRTCRRPSARRHRLAASVRLNCLVC